MPTVREVVAFLAEIGETDLAMGAAHPAGEVALSGIRPDRAAGAGDLAWLSPRQAVKHPERVTEFRGSLLVAPEAVQGEPSAGGVAVRCRTPKLAFTRAVLQFFPHLGVTRWPAAGETPVLPGTTVGHNVQLAPGVVIGSGVTLGDDVVVGPNTCIANATIGRNVRIGCNCTIGLAGFGYEKDAAGRYWRFPHAGGVIIEDDVEIGSNTCIDRGAMGDTIIGAGSKIDNLVHVAHNVVVGRHALLIANCMIGGSTVIEDGAWIAPGAALMNQITIGRSAIVGLGAVVVKDVPEAAVVVGNPARRLERPA